MKNRFLFFVGLSALVVVGCGKKEGVVSAKHKIDKVIATENRWEEAEQIFAGDEYVAEQWVWDGRKVIRIDYRGDEQYSENFFYDGRKIISTTVPAYDLRNEFQYDGRKLDKIDVYKKEKLAATMTFAHNDDVIIEIVVKRVEVDSDMVWPMWSPMPLKMLVGKSVANTICSNEIMASDKRAFNQPKSSNSDVETHYRLSWDKDHKNVEKIEVNGNGINPYTIELKYDKKINPYAQLYANHEINESIFGLKMLSENNVTFIRMPFNNLGVIDFNYTYTYEDDYPATCNLTYNYVSLSATFDSVTVRIEQKEKFFYK